MASRARRLACLSDSRPVSRTAGLGRAGQGKNDQESHENPTKLPHTPLRVLPMSLRRCCRLDAWQERLRNASEEERRRMMTEELGPTGNTKPAWWRREHQPSGASASQD
jgi:hypothetical protein